MKETSRISFDLPAALHKELRNVLPPGMLSPVMRLLVTQVVEKVHKHGPAYLGNLIGKAIDVNDVLSFTEESLSLMAKINAQIATNNSMPDEEVNDANDTSNSQPSTDGSSRAGEVLPSPSELADNESSD